MIFEKKNEEAIRIKFDNTIQLPDYNARDYAIIANQTINKTVALKSSRQYRSSTYFITTINKIPRSIQQRIAGGSSTSWHNMVAIYNYFSDELGYNKITNTKKISNFDITIILSSIKKNVDQNKR